MTKPLTFAAVKRLVAAGESETLELKRTTGELRGAGQTLCGLLNQRGGVVVFGVAADGRIAGQEVNDGTLRDVAAAVRDIDPAPRVDVRRIEAGGGRSLIVLRADAGSAAPYTYDGRPFIRLGSTTRRMNREEYERRLLARLHARHRWETLPATSWSIADLDADEIRQTVVEAVAAKRLAAVPSEKPEAILRRLNLLADGHPTQAAVVLFSRNPLPQFPQCEIRLARFRGVAKSEFIDHRQFQGHAFALLRQADAFFDMHLPVASRIVSGRMRREDRPQYPPEALRDALVNALCHRDYSEAGASVGVAIFDDRLEVWSYGRLPGGLTTQQLLGDHPSVRRNELIADVFYRRGYIEKWGRGTQKILDLCRRIGARDPEFVEQGGEIGVRFWPAFRAPAHKTPGKLTERQDRLLAVLRARGVSSLAELVGGVGGGVTERTVQRDLETLRAQGLVQLTGRGRGARYSLGSEE